MKNIFIFMLIGILLFSSIGLALQPGEQTGESPIPKSFLFTLSRLFQSYSIYGEQRQCDTRYDDHPPTYGVVTSVNDGQVVTCPGLLNIYNQDSSGDYVVIDEIGRDTFPATWTVWVPYGWTRVWECYNCPYAPCESDSDCVGNSFGNTCNRNYGNEPFGTNVPIGNCYEEDCVEDWECGSWTSCVNGWQTKECIDRNECGTADNKPTEGRSCVQDLDIDLISYSIEDTTPSDYLIIKAKYRANAAGTYLLEAFVEPITLFSILFGISKISINRCDIESGDIEDPRYKNDRIYFSAGETREIDFEFITTFPEGKYKAYLDVLPDCRSSDFLVQNTYVGEFILSQDGTTPPPDDGTIPPDDSCLANGETDWPLIGKECCSGCSNEFLTCVDCDAPCTSNVDCDFGYSCVSGECVYTTTECNPGYHLENGECVIDVCTPKLDHTSCCLIFNCAKEYYTCGKSPITFYCDEFPNGECVSGECVYEPVDEGCNTGYHLENGVCVKDDDDTTTTTTTTTITPPEDKPNFQLEFVSVPAEASAGDTISVSVKITNLGASGSMRVETGLYYDKTLDDWFKDSGLFAISSANLVENCEPLEKNIQTKQITLSSGASGTEIFRFKIPETICSLTGSLIKTSKLDIYSGAMEKCYKTGQATGITDAIRRNIEIEPNAGLFCKSCSDGLQNGDETDTDCGGKDCSTCRVGYMCNLKADCESNLVCNENGRCAEPSGTDSCEPFLLRPRCSISRTKAEFKEATKKMVTDSLCDFDKHCESRTDYEVKCVAPASAGASVSLIDRVLFPHSGVCLATSEEKLDVCGLLEPLAFIGITGDDCTDGGILIGGIILIALLFLRR